MNKILTRAFKKSNAPFNPDPKFYINKIEQAPLPQKIMTFQIMDFDGKPINDSYKNIQRTLLNKVLKTMIITQQMDRYLYMSQRQGKISFYMPSLGETATTVGVAAGLQNSDLIYPQYRQQGSFLFRGFTIDQAIAQCIGNKKDLNKGRQMSVHYGSSNLNIVTVSSPLTTQVPQASGAGYGFKLQKANRIAVPFFGQGATSQGDFHAAMNFACTLKSQTLFACRNNHYAISTHYSQQFKGDGLSKLAVGYGMRTMRVDGNDAIAVIMATKYARQQIIKSGQPFFIEYMTYRISDHSTSDYSNLYRQDQQRQSWQKKNNPITRLINFLKQTNQKDTSDSEDNQLRIKTKEDIIKLLKQNSQQKLPSINLLFQDVYDLKPASLKQQQKQLLDHLKRNPKAYDLSKFD